MSSSTICILIAIVAYLGMMLYLGFRYSKASKSSDEFYLGGRQLGPYVTAMSAEARPMAVHAASQIPEA